MVASAIKSLIARRVCVRSEPFRAAHLMSIWHMDALSTPAAKTCSSSGLDAKVVSCYNDPRVPRCPGSFPLKPKNGLEYWSPQPCPWILFFGDSAWLRERTMSMMMCQRLDQRLAPRRHLMKTPTAWLLTLPIAICAFESTLCLSVRFLQICVRSGVWANVEFTTQHSTHTS